MNKAKKLTKNLSKTQQQQQQTKQNNQTKNPPNTKTFEEKKNVTGFFCIISIRQESSRKINVV